MVERISRSEQKRLLKQVEELAQEISVLTDSDLDKMDLDSEIRETVIACRGLKGGALKRQVKYLSKLMRDCSLDGIYEFMQQRKGSELKDKQKFHRAERWRDILINEALEVQQECRVEDVPFELDYDSALIYDLEEEISGIDPMEIRRVIYSYAKTRNKTHHRELFRIIKAAIESKERGG